MHIRTYETTIGTLGISSDGDAIHDVFLPNAIPAEADGQEDELMADTIGQIQEYLSGIRKEFDIPFVLHGTEFQNKVWECMCTIGYGETMTYGQVAERIGHPNAFRAVGTACGMNRLPLIVPCHRIVAAGGIGGFSGGLEIKKHLLKLEEEYR